MTARVVFGDHDEVGLTTEERQALTACRHVTLDIVGCATHFLITDEPAQVAELILSCCYAPYSSN